MYYGDLPSRYQFRIIDESNHSSYLTIYKNEGYIDNGNFLMSISGYISGVEEVEVTFFYN